MDLDRDKEKLAKLRYPKRKGCGCNQKRQDPTGEQREDAREELPDYEESSDKLFDRIKKFFL